jgi:hypothetical protein
MAGDWSESTLGKEAEILTGFPFKSTFYAEKGVRLLRGDNVAQGRIRWDGVKLWPEHEIADFRRYQLEPHDVILAMDRPWIDAGLKYGVIYERDLPALLVQRVARLRGGPRLDQRYLRYLIGSRQFTEHVLAVQTGSAVPHISKGQIEEYRFLLPPLDEQRAITAILGALDDKIEVNNRLHKSLETIDRAIFKAWFVDFEPVKEKAAGATTFRGMPQDVFDILPNQIVENDVGPIPLGWTSATISELVLLSRDSVQPADYPDETFEHFSIPAFDAALTPTCESGGTIQSSKYQVIPESVLVSKLNPRFPRVWLPSESESGKRQIASTEFLVATPRQAGLASIFTVSSLNRGFVTECSRWYPAHRTAISVSGLRIFRACWLSHLRSRSAMLSRRS